MRDNIQNEAGVTGNHKIESPFAVYASLPDIARLIIFLGVERRVAGILQQ